MSSQMQQFGSGITALTEYESKIIRVVDSHPVTVSCSNAAIERCIITHYDWRLLLPYQLNSNLIYILTAASKVSSVKLTTSAEAAT